MGSLRSIAEKSYASIKVKMLNAIRSNNESYRQECETLLIELERDFPDFTEDRHTDDNFRLNNSTD